MVCENMNKMKFFIYSEKDKNFKSNNREVDFIIIVL